MIIYGKQPVLYAVQFHAEQILSFYVAKELPKGIFAQISRLHKPIERIDTKKAQALAHNGNHQGIFAKIIPPQSTSLQTLKRKNSLLVLCDISDVGNLGSIVRSAYGLGVEGVIIVLSSFVKQTKVNSPNVMSDKMMEGIIRLSSGAFLDMPFMVSRNVYDIVNELKSANFTLFGADAKSSIYVANVQNKWVLFLGSESQGLVARLKHKLDTILGIEMQRDFDSLNVSVAAGILIDRINYGKQQ